MEKSPVWLSGLALFQRGWPSKDSVGPPRRLVATHHSKVPSAYPLQKVSVDRTPQTETDLLGSPQMSRFLRKAGFKKVDLLYFLSVRMSSCVWVQVCVHTCGDGRAKVSVFRSHSPSYLLWSVQTGWLAISKDAPVSTFLLLGLDVLLCSGFHSGAKTWTQTSMLLSLQPRERK